MSLFQYQTEGRGEKGGGGKWERQYIPKWFRILLLPATRSAWTL